MTYRIIKFRAWDRVKNEMCFKFMLPSTGEGIPVMQFTGLLDKNGKEIYEGDIIEHEVYDKPYSLKQKRWKIRKEVYWSKGFDDSPRNIKLNPILKTNPSFYNQNPQFRARKIDKEAKDGGYNWSEFCDCEIIGNIYENPTLLA